MEADASNRTEDSATALTQDTRMLVNDKSNSEQWTRHATQADNRDISSSSMDHLFSTRKLQLKSE